MHSDSHFCIGKAHKVCQDYALSGKTGKGQAYAIVSDGCSGSPDTDWGSRFMAKAMQHAFENDNGIHWAVSFGQQMASSCNVHPYSLDATVLAALETTQGDSLGVQVTVVGDGYVVARRRNEIRYDVYAFEFYHGFPAYSSYLLDLDRLLEYAKQTDHGLASVRISESQSEESILTRHNFYPMEPEKWLNPYTIFFPQAKYDVVSVFSDGLASFQQAKASETVKHQVPVAVSEVLAELHDFKNMNGEFVTRRAKKFLGKTCDDKQWSHFDDFSMASIAL